LAAEPEHAAHVLRGIKVLDDRFANPAYGLLLVTGIVLVVIGDIGFFTFWIAAALILYVVTVVVAVTVFSPALRTQVELAEQGRIESDEYRALARTGALVGGLLGVLVLLIEFLMVTKATL
jgi:uncharacterized membrane protein